MKLITDMSEFQKCQSRRPTSIVDFDRMKEEDFIPLIGITMSQFEQLVAAVNHGETGKPRLYVTAKSSPGQVIGALLFKLKHDIGHEALSRLFGFTSTWECSKKLARAEHLLTSYFVPLHLGYDCITVSDVREKHTSAIAAAMYEKKAGAVLVADGTYLYCEKTSDFGKLLFLIVH